MAVFQTSQQHPFKLAKRFYFIGWLILTLSFIKSANGWDTDELEMFDLVEELNTNFYLVLGVPEDADTKEIKKAFRKLSLTMHPDKNHAEDADVKFRQIVAVYEILSDEQKRSRYNDVLEHGLPDWKHAVYYYRRVRKMGLLEMTVILFIIVTFGQYIVLWAAYAEKKYTVEQFVNSKIKKIQKKQRKTKSEGDGPEIKIILPKPSVFDLLPCRAVYFVWFVITSVPTCYQLLREKLVEYRQQKPQESEESSDESLQDDEVEEKPKRRRRKAFLPPERGDDDDLCLLEPTEENQDSDFPSATSHRVISGGLWTDDDLAELARLVKKFPGGISQRWEKIADSMNRSVAEVTLMARKLKDINYKPNPLGTNDETQTIDVSYKPSKVKTKGGKSRNATEEIERDGISEQSLWTQTQQKALENAMIKFPKGSLERWSKISKCVHGKSQEECMIRYKELVELVKKKKQQSMTENGATSSIESENTESPGIEVAQNGVDDIVQS